MKKNRSLFFFFGEEQFQLFVVHSKNYNMAVMQRLGVACARLQNLTSLFVLLLCNQYYSRFVGFKG
jgi:hypothetical protein